MNIRTLAVHCMLCTMLIGCAGVEVSQDYDSGRSFSAFQRYDWKSQVATGNEDDIRKNDPLLHKRFYTTISKVLEERGYRQNQDADFLVDYDFSITSRLESDPVTTGFGAGFGPRRHYVGLGINTGSDIRQHDIGILVIDFYDARSGTLVWRGKGSDIISVHSTPQQATAMVDSMVRAIIAQYPPQEK